MTTRKIEIEDELLQSLNLLALDSGRTVNALIDEALRLLLKKHHRPANLGEALRMSLRQHGSNDNKAPARTRA